MWVSEWCLSLSYGAREDCVEEDISAEQVSNKTKSKLHSEQIHHPFSSPNNTVVMKSKKMRWTGHVARMGKKRHTYIHGLTFILLISLPFSNFKNKSNNNNNNNKNKQQQQQMQSNPTNIYVIYWRKYSPRFACIEAIIRLYSKLGSSDMCSKFTSDKITCELHLLHSYSWYIKCLYLYPSVQWSTVGVYLFVKITKLT